tara:strand:+ start:3024 stop:4367 length:1344 start_codon:yes stop_codon:yes gene_type:complete
VQNRSPDIKGEGHPAICTDIEIRTPKRNKSLKSKKELFPYYAGFSEEFAQDVLRTCPEHSNILDPWNGSGTTTFVTQNLGLKSIGLDLNPAMVVVSKARLSFLDDIRLAENELEALSLSFPGASVFKACDVLEMWVGREASYYFRWIVCSALQLDPNETNISLKIISDAVSSAAAWQCFIILTVFRVVKNNAMIEKSSNPTWIKSRKLETPAGTGPNLIEWKALLRTEFSRLSEISLVDQNKNFISNHEFSAILCASSEKMPISNDSIDFVLTSPPYCTRIDYAKSTLIELSVLGLPLDEIDGTVRRSLMGTTAIKNVQNSLDLIPSDKCRILLDRIKNHASSGSKSYYFKNFSQYFHSLNNSIGEISRVLKVGGISYVVVQGSHYKELEIDLPGIFEELSCSHGIILKSMLSFESSKHFGRINIKSLKYKKHSIMNEKVLILEKAI